MKGDDKQYLLVDDEIKEGQERLKTQLSGDLLINKTEAFDKSKQTSP
jgi:hypothetical protein